MSENPARRPWTVGMWQVDNKSVGKHWRDSLSIIDADGGEVAVLTRGYEGDKNGDGCPSWKNAVLIVAGVNALSGSDEFKLGMDIARRECWEQVSALIKTGDLGGHGWDKNAERNGIVLAANVLFANLSD